MTKPTQAVVVGLGQTGLSCVRYLRACGYNVSVVDSRANPPQGAALRAAFPDVQVVTGGFSAQAFVGADLLVVSPGVSVQEPAIAAAAARGIEVVGDIELFARALPAHAGIAVVAITGSNGKSTVTSLVGAMCDAAGFATQVGGNIGVPVLDLLSEPADVIALELSSFQLETTSSLNARAACVLNITPDHMDRYRDLDDYAQAKARVFRGDGVMVLNRDDPLVMAMGLANRRRAHFSLGVPQSEQDYGVRIQGGEEWLAHGARLVMPVKEIPLPGRHNVANVLAAMALADIVDVPVDAMIRAVMQFKGLAHRTELVTEIDGVRWLNDSKGTNVGATVAALNGMTAPVVLIAGGDGKGQDFAPLAPAVAAHARTVILIGRDAKLIERALAGCVAIEHARDMEDAVQRAHGHAQAGDVALLSPACASFDMFKNYEHRGAVFAQAVRALKDRA